MKSLSKNKNDPVNYIFVHPKSQTLILDIRSSPVIDIIIYGPVNFSFEMTKTKAKTKTFILDIRSSLVRDIMRRGPVNFTFAKKEGQLFSSYYQQLVKKKEATKFQILLHRWILKSRDLYIWICLCVG